MKNLKPNPILASWASETTNKIEVTQAVRNQGIAYKGPVVSDQLNGLGNDIYNSVMYNQYTGGMYNASLTYNIGQFCTILWKENNSILKFVKCYCIQDNNGAGLKAVPPIKNASITTNNGVDTYNGGELDKDNWGFYFETPFTNLDISTVISNPVANGSNWFTFWTFKPIPASASDSLTKNISAKFDMIVTKQIGSMTISYIIKVRVEGTYLLTNLSGQYFYLLTNSLGIINQLNIYFDDMPYCSNTRINLNIDSISAFIPDINAPGQSLYGTAMPYGIKFHLPIVSQMTDINKIYIETRNISSIRIVGNSNVELTLTPLSSAPIMQGKITFPVRPNGGFNCIDKIGNIVTHGILTSLAYNKLTYAQRGLFLLGSTYPTDISDDWFSLLSFMRFSGTASVTLRQYLTTMTSRFPRMHADSLSATQVESTEEDAIRNITGSFGMTDIDTSGLYTFNANLKMMKGAFGTEPVTVPYSMDTSGSLVKPISVPKIDASLVVPTTDTITGENRPKSIVWSYYIQCF